MAQLFLLAFPADGVPIRFPLLVMDVLVDFADDAADIAAAGS